MLRVFNVMLFTLVLFLGSTYAFAEVVPVPEVDLFGEIAKLIVGWKGLSGIAKGVSFVLILTQVIKQLGDFAYKRLVVTLMSISYGILLMLVDGADIKTALVSVIVSGGGAVAIYEGLKPILAKISFFDFLNLGKK